MARKARWTLPSQFFLSLVLSDFVDAPAVAGTISATSANRAAAKSAFGFLKAMS
ncbi:MAG: hypothetical protein ACTHNY_03015 [Solirubrobacterales bacterium]